MTAFEQWLFEGRSTANQLDSSRQPKVTYFLVLVTAGHPISSIQKSGDLESLFLEAFSTADSAAPQYIYLGRIPGHESCRHQPALEPGQGNLDCIEGFYHFQVDAVWLRRFAIKSLAMSLFAVYDHFLSLCHSFV